MPNDKFGNPDFTTALQMFVNGTKELAMTRALSGANEAVAQVKGSELNEQKQRAAMQGIANNLVLQMTGLGANADQIQLAGKAVGPAPLPTIQSTEQALYMGDDVQKKAALGAQAREQRYALDRIAAQNAGRLDLQSAKVDNTKSKALTTEELNKINNFDDASGAMKAINGMLDKDTTLVGPIDANKPFRDKYDPSYGAFRTELGQLLDAYRVAVTGAGASEKELKTLESRMPNGTETETVFRAKLKQVQTIADRKKASLLRNYGAAGRDLGTLSAPASVQSGEGQAPVSKPTGIPGLKF